jgi:hypothetical protein
VLVLPVGGDPVLVVDSVEYRDDLVAVDDVRVGLNVPATVAAVLREQGLAHERLGLVGRESLLLSSYQILIDELGGAPRFEPAEDPSNVSGGRRATPSCGWFGMQPTSACAVSRR